MKIRVLDSSDKEVFQGKFSHIETTSQTEGPISFHFSVVNGLDEWDLMFLAEDTKRIKEIVRELNDLIKLRDNQ